MKMLIACEESQAVTKQFRLLGHEAFSCDIIPTSGENPEWHIQADVRTILNDGWDMMIAFPTCTYLTVTANKWFKDQPARKSGALVGAERRSAREEAVLFFMILANTDIDKIAIENPVGVMSSRWRKPDQIICPTMFGHKEPKKTCLWLKNVPKLTPTNIVKPEYHECASGKRMPKWYAYADKSKGQAERAKIRSKTFPGVAKAMSAQWG